MRWILRDDHAQFAANTWTITTTFGDVGPHLHLKSRSHPELYLDLQIEPQLDFRGAEVPRIPRGDVYVRMNDLIASYPEKEPWTFGYQVDVRFVDIHESHCVCLEMWLSVQTSQLDSYPQLLVQVAHLPFAEICTGVWISNDDRYCLAVHPLDQSDSKVISNDENKESIAMHVFGRFMEKGVIRRMRFRLFASEEPKPTSFWNHQLELFSESPLPLTT